MVNREKIITMTKLTLYDKHEGPSDREANEYFRHDYIYKKNIGTRIAVGLGGVILLALYWLRVIFVDGRDIFELPIQTHVMEGALIIVAIIAVYSVIGTIQGTREYYLVQKRLKKYHALIKFLENIDNRKARTAAGEEEQPEPEPEEETPVAEEEPPVEPGLAPLDILGPEPAPLDELIPPRPRRRRPPEPEVDPDPLANVSKRALSGSRPRARAPRPDSPRDKPRPRYTIKPGKPDDK